MTTATMAYLALLGGWAAHNNEALPAAPAVLTDYAAALAEAARTHKPVVVFIGNTAAPLREQLQGLETPAEAIELLRQRYVVVEISRQEAKGREVADLFELQEGVVISGPGGRLQAYRHGGAWQVRQLLPQLRQYAAAGAPSTTVCSGTAAAGTSCTACGGGACPAASATVTTCSGGTCTAPTSGRSGVVPARGYYYVVPSSSCSNGSCYRR